MMACLTDMALGLMFKIATKIQHFESASDIVSDSLTNEQASHAHATVCQ